MPHTNDALLSAQLMKWKQKSTATVGGVAQEFESLLANGYCGQPAMDESSKNC